jgi:NAD(P)-dependent dehydrogenase (short-subunit alcohol dehydrogenase family)
MRGKTILITGGTDGIGLALVRKLMPSNQIIVLGRSELKLNQLFGAEEKVKTYVVNLSSMEEVNTVSNKIQSDFDGIDLLIHNASCVSSERVLTEEGFELQLAVNYLAPSLLTANLLALIKVKKGSVLFVNSRAHKRVRFDITDPQLETGYGLSKAYNRSKLYLLLFAKKASELLGKEAVTVHSVHPGLVNTMMGEKQCDLVHRVAWKAIKRLGKSPETAAENITKLIDSNKFKESTGLFFGPKKQEAPAIVFNDVTAKHNLWVLTEKLLQTSIL